LNYAGVLVRFIVCVVVFAITSALVPGVRINGMTGVFAASFIITLLTFLVDRIAGAGNKNIWQRRWMGYVTAVAVIYLTQYFIPQYFIISIPGTLFTALFVGLADTFIPQLLR